MTGWRRKKRYVSIELLEPLVFTYTNSPSVLRGSVKLRLAKHNHLHKLSLLLHGKMKAFQFHGQKRVKPDKEIYHSLTLHSKDDPAFEIQNPTTLYSFEMSLPNDMPESLHSQYIHMSYELWVIMKAKNNKNKWIHEERSVPLVIARAMDVSDTDIIDSRRCNCSEYQYRVTLETRYGAPGSILPVQCEMMAHIDNVHLKKVHLQLIERSNIFTGEKTSYLYPRLRSLDDDQGVHLVKGENISEVFHFELPTTATHSSASAPYFHVEHHLVLQFVLSIRVQDVKGEWSEIPKLLTFQTHFHLLDKLVCGHSMPLPLYDLPLSEEAWTQQNKHRLLPPPPDYN